MFAFVASFGLLLSTASATVVNVQINTVTWASEINFSVSDSSGAYVLVGTGTGSYSNYSTYDNYVDLADPGCYTLTMLDSWGDGWNGGNVTLIDSASGVTIAVYTGTGFWSTNIENFCLPFVFGCTDPIASNYDSTATVDDGTCTYVLGCTDSTANNYDPLATQDDGTCTYNLGCLDPLASNFDSLAVVDDGSCTYACLSTDSLEGFEGTTLGRWFNSPSNNVGYNSLAQELKGWRINSGTTGSSNTGPTSASQGLQYIYVETSGSQVGQTAEISLCVDLSNWTVPGMSWNYHMWGGSIGTLDVDVSTDAGLTWTNAWSLSGDQGNFWQSAFVDLSSYSGVVDVRFNYTILPTSGSPNWEADASLDNVGFSELTLGCTDPFADNYDPLASIDDGSCLYSGCLDIYASNYCASCNVPDASLCTYYACGTLNYIEDTEVKSLTSMGYTTSNGNEVDGLSFSSAADALIDTVSLQFTGGDNFYATQTSATAFTNNPERQASASFCLDLSGSGSEVDLKFSAGLSSAVANRAWFRVLVNGVVQNESISGTDHFSDANQLTGFTSTNTNANSYGEYLYELDAYAGQSNVYVTFQAMVNHNVAYGTAGYVWVDNIEAYEVTPCTYYEIQELFSFDDDCNGGGNGNAMVIANNSQSVSGDIYTWLTSTGSIYATSQQVTNLVAGTYTVTATDPDNGCNDALQITITEPSAVTIDTSATFIVNTPTVNDSVGLINITATGGTPCLVNNATTAGTHNSVYTGFARGYAFTAQSSFNLAEVRAADAATLDPSLVEQSIEILDLTGGGMVSIFYAANQPTGWIQTGGLSIVAGNTYAIIGAKHVDNPPSFGMVNSYGGSGQSFIIDGISTPVQRVGAQGNLSYGQVGAGGGSLLNPTTGSIGRLEIKTSVPGPDPYTYSWSTGATTQNISGLGVGSYTVTITDCNGCIGSETFFITAAVDSGCTDPLANNYDPSANLDDGSCQYLGCTDTNAINYTIGANVDDGSCTYNCAYSGYDGDLVIDMHDSFGDGWNGSVLYITNVNGDTINTGGSTILTGFENDDSLCVYSGCYEVNVTSNPWNGEVSWEILVDGDTVLAVASPGSPGTWTFEVGTGACNLGCTDSTAQNFDPNAVTDNGSCMYTCADNVVILNMSDAGGGWGGSLFNLYDGSGNLVTSTTYGGTFASWDTLCLDTGCYNLVVTLGLNNPGVSWSLSDGSGTVFLTGGAPYSDTVCLPAFGGCTDMNACNYDSLATTNDGTCDYSCVGCADPTALNWSGPSFTIDDGSCYYCALSTSGFVTDASANGAANGAIDLSVSGSYCVDGPLDAPLLGGNGQAGNMFNLINTSGADISILGMSQGPGSGGSSITGVNSEWWYSVGDYTVSANWISAGSATVDLTTGAATGTVTFANPIIIPVGATYAFHVINSATIQYTNGTGTPGSSVWASDGNLTITEGHGCAGFGTLDFSPRNWNGSVNYSTGASASYVWSNGDTTEDISNLNPGIYSVAVTDCQGCTASDTFIVLANPIPGCTDPLAVNYNPAANVDDGSCFLPVDGCTDPLAVNYNPLANTDDGTCLVCVGSITAPWTEDFDIYTSGSTDFSGNGWYNDSIHDDWEWTVDANGTGSFGTGPGNDISGGGNYIYTETSGAGSNKTANANSVCVNTSNLTTPNIRFSYHMFGTTMGTLELVVDDVVVWSQSGNLGDQWLQAQVPLPSDTNVLIQFRGLTGTSFTSDMALDQIIVDDGLTAGCTDPTANNYNVLALIDDGSCTYNVGCTDPGASNYDPIATVDDGSCTYACIVADSLEGFEGTTTGRWFNSSTNNVGSTAGNQGWRINSGATGSGGTGPSAASQGLQYIYVEASGSQAGQTAEISLCVDLANWTSPMMYWDYHMFGAGMGTLDVDVSTDGGSTWTNEWSLSGDQGNLWQYAILDLSSYSGVVDVRFNLTINPAPAGAFTFQSDAALDDIGFSEFAPIPVFGCIDPLALNTDPLANTDDGSCVYPCALNLVYSSMLTDFNKAECSFEISNDSGQVVYTSPALSGGGSILVNDSICLPDGCYTLTLLDSGNDGWVAGNLGNVTLTDGAGAALAYGQMFFGNSVSYSFTAGVCQAAILGCTDSTSSNYDPLANVDDGSCCVDGCTDPLAFNFDSLATCDDGSCAPFVFGCTDAAAINFYPGANTDDGSCIYVGCTDPTAANYNPLATINDGSCTYFSCSDPVPTGVAVNWTTDTKAEITWDNMNVSTCLVDKYFVRYRVDNLDGTYGPWVTKSGGAGNGLCNFGLNTTVKRLQFLTSATTYQVKVKAFYCGNTSSSYSSPVSFTTGSDCPPMTNLTVSTFNNNYAKARFQWDSTGAYVFARVALRVDTVAAAWQTAGGFGVNYPTLEVNKFGLQQGESYRAQGRTFCDPNITSYRSFWTSPIFWTQPGQLPIRGEGGTTINNLDVYPNPSRDIFNVTFVAEDIQNLEVRVINVVGEVVYTEALEQFVGEYTKQIDLTDNSKGVYFLEITTNSGVVNKKLIIQ